MILNIIWFVLISVLFIGYFVLEGFDFGVGILLPFLGKNENRRKAMVETIGPHWDGNEVWLITAGGAMFAAFPHWYATLFSGFYFPFALLLLGLILRGVAIEFRGKEDGHRWRNTWDWLLFVGSFIPALLTGVLFANLMRGIPIDASMNYVGGFLNLLNPYALLGGLVSLIGFTLQGALFLAMKTTGDQAEQARRMAQRIWVVAVVILLGFSVYTYLETDILTKLGVNPGVVPIGAVLALLITIWFVREKRDGWAFTMHTFAIVFAGATIFMYLFPNVLISSLNPAWSMTIETAASGQYTLRTMSIVALIFLPIVLGYEAWSFYLFRKRVTEKTAGEY